MELNSSVIVSRPNKHTRQPYRRMSIGEMRLLRQLLTQAHQVLQQNNRLSELFDKPLWVQIANHMHALGWPKRSWIRLRRNVVNFNGFSARERLLPPAPCTTNPTSPTSVASSDQMQNEPSVPSSSPSTSRKSDLPVVRSTDSTRHNSNNITSSQTTMRVNTPLNVATKVDPPRLVHSSEAFAFCTNPQVVPAVSRAGQSKWNHKSHPGLAEHVSNPACPPWTVKTSSANCSSQTTTTNTTNTNTTNNHNNLIGGGFDQIDSSVCSDDSGAHSACSHQQPGRVVMDRKHLEMITLDSQDRRTLTERQFAEREFAMRLRVHEKKLEVLEWKRAFWALKCRSLNQTSTAPR